MVHVSLEIMELTTWETSLHSLGMQVTWQVTCYDAHVVVQFSYGSLRNSLNYH